MPDDSPIERDEAWMALAIRLAERGLGTTAPNPAVGAVIVDETTGEVVGRGWTQPGGRPHAEVEAIARAGARARGKTIYVTLEPCAHHGKTPPCVDAVLAAGLTRVVCGIEDPDPRVAGKGLNKLREHGVIVRRAVLRSRANWVTLGHILKVTERRPFIQLKIAVDAAGHIAAGTGSAPVWVTGPLARAHGHLLRARADAILVGAGTARADNPSLDCRLPGLASRSPVRVVLTRNLAVPDEARLMNPGEGAPVWWYCGSDILPSRLAEVQTAGGDVTRVRSVSGRLWLPAVMEHLVARGMTRVLVEGGPAIWRAFDQAGLIDEVMLYHARAEPARAVEERAALAALRRYVPSAVLPRIARRGLGTDDVFSFRRRVVAD
ncbi:MAG: bifunctional diaminohydroxyphosphoribosylaminopyrimidine deaminase/5-amino-6-(5-phosphoribosylamino)uracil reductase RibD [Hyphomicrobiaceae bacterium]|nr:bifunctional diaminohydroxyphosphoribosylaminopyrimidine deaminase/5-amino-6-(5-phosphoribosylamino)uracil reductase RibD [Hyphomicrobiaceae bacterium]